MGSGDGVPRPLRRAADISWRFLVVAAAIGVVLLVLARLRLVVLPVVVALFLTVLLAPPVRWLERRGLPPLLATWLVLLVVLGSFAAVVYAVMPSVVSEFEGMGDAVSEGWDEVRDWLVDGPLDLEQEQIDDFFDRVGDEITEGSVGEQLVTGAALAVEIVVGVLLTLVLLFFFVKDGPRMARWLLDRVPTEQQKTVAALARRGWWVLGAYFRGTALNGLVEAAASAIVLLVLGVPLVLPVALLFFFGAFFPLVGATVAGTVATLVTLVSVGTTEALIVLAAVIAIQQLEGNVLEPFILSRVMQLHPVVVLLALTAGAVTAGLAGAFLAVPVAAALVGVVNELRGDNQLSKWPPDT